jgi:hypothetical protein
MGKFVIFLIIAGLGIPLLLVVGTVWTFEDVPTAKANARQSLPLTGETVAGASQGDAEATDEKRA